MTRYFLVCPNLARNFFLVLKYLAFTVLPHPCLSIKKVRNSNMCGVFKECFNERIFICDFFNDKDISELSFRTKWDIRSNVIS